jgi:hypothetical protein
MRWCTLSSFSHCFWGCLGRKRPNLLVWVVSCGRVGAIQVFCIVSVILFVRSSNVVHAYCHCSGVNCGFWFNWFVRLSIMRECVDRNVRLKWSRVCCGIGFSSLCAMVGCGGGGRANKKLFGIFNDTRK